MRVQAHLRKPDSSCPEDELHLQRRRVGDFGSLTELAATFLFADIAGFTALTEAHGDEQAATLVADFCDAVKAGLPAGAAHVKTIGDALMLRIPDPCEAILLGLHITHGLMRGHRAPAVRVGLHHGGAIERDSNGIHREIALSLLPFSHRGEELDRLANVAQVANS